MKHIQALHAAISRRDWHAVEVAANAIRDAPERISGEDRLAELEETAARLHAAFEKRTEHWLDENKRACDAEEENRNILKAVTQVCSAEDIHQITSMALAAHPPSEQISGEPAPYGWVMVPTKPTPEMTSAFHSTTNCVLDEAGFAVPIWEKQYASMLAATPSSEQISGEAERIADAVLAWMVKHEYLDTGYEYYAADVVNVLNVLIASSPSEQTSGKTEVPFAYCCSGPVDSCDCVNKSHGTALVDDNSASLYREQISGEVNSGFTLSGNAKPTFECAARSGSVGANDSQDCDHPHCGCDPSEQISGEAVERTADAVARVVCAGPDVAAGAKIIEKAYSDLLKAGGRHE